MLTGTAKLAGVIGWPVAHSRSPRLHGHWIARHGLDAAYLPLAVEPGNFPVAVRGLLASGFRGANVTIPHKEAAFAACDSVTERARRAGAVNTLVFDRGRIEGDNTDGWGFVENLRQQGADPAAGPALILGAGGSARAIAAALAEAGAQVTLANRTRARAEALAAALPGLSVIDWDRRSAAVADHALLVNTTSQGMKGQGALEIDLSAAPAAMSVADIVYVPLETPLLAAAAARGLRAVDGLGMLLHQARAGFRAWFGVDPVVDDALRDFVAGDIPRR